MQIKKMAIIFFTFILILWVLPVSSAMSDTQVIQQTIDIPTVTISNIGNISFANSVNLSVSVSDPALTLNEVMVFAVLFNGATFITSSNARELANGRQSFDVSLNAQLLGDNAGFTLRVFVWGDNMTPLEGGYLSHYIVASAIDEPPGEGTETDPFLISTPEHLLWINENAERLVAHYLVVADIVAPDNLIIANSARFDGVFNGGSHTITVNVNLPHVNEVGLFGSVGENGIIRNLNIAGQVIGSNYVGGLVGENFGFIENVSVSANIIGDTNVGGIVGLNRGTITHSFTRGDIYGDINIGGISGNNHSGTVTRSYSRGSVVGGYSVGGVVGYNQAIVSNVYSASDIVGENAVGGIVGTNVGVSANIMSSYSAGEIVATYAAGGIAGLNSNGALIENSISIVPNINGTPVGRIWGENYGNATGARNRVRQFMLINGQIDIFGAGSVAEQSGQNGHVTSTMIMNTQTFWSGSNVNNQMGWDMTNIWQWSGTPQNLPVLRGISGLDGQTGLAIQDHRLITMEPIPDFDSGDGTAGNPFIISRAEQLTYINLTAFTRRAHYRLANNIEDIVDFIICPEYTRAFNGNFDGNGYTITVNINQERNGVGLFGFVGNGGIVRNLNVIGYVTGLSSVGGIAGQNNGIILNVSSNVNVTAIFQNAGGLVGITGSGGSGRDLGTVRNSYSIGVVTGNMYVGGLVGQNWGGNIENSYFAGVVSGDMYVAGIVGFNSAFGPVLQNTVALNHNISTTAFPGRIFAHRLANTTEVNNHAYANMLINGLPLTEARTLTNEHGQDVDVSTIHTQEFWQNTMGWDFDNAWMWNNLTNLPVLRSIRSTQNHTL